MKGSQVVATVPARIVALPKAATNDGTETKSIGEKQTALTGIYFHGKAQALAIDQGHNVEMATDK